MDDADPYAIEAEIEKFVDDSNMYNMLQEEPSEIPGNESSGVLSQGHEQQLHAIEAFYGSSHPSK